MIDERFIIVGVFLSLVGGLNYLIDTVKGKTQPNKVTWFLWALAPLIAFTAEVQQGVGWQSSLTFIVGFNPLMIFLASFITLATIDQWNFQHYAFPVYILLLCIILYALVKFKIGRILKLK